MQSGKAASRRSPTAKEKVLAKFCQKYDALGRKDYKTLIVRGHPEITPVAVKEKRNHFEGIRRSVKQNVMKTSQATTSR